MTACVITAHAGVEDGVPCLERGAHGGDCPGDTCTGCRPTPAAPGRIACTRHGDAVRAGLQDLADLYAALAESTTRNAPPGAGDPADTPEAIPPIPAARMLIRSTLVGWSKVLADDFGVPVPDERQIELDTRGAITRRQWDVDIAVDGMRSKPGRPRPTPERRAELARAAEAHRRVIRAMMDDRAGGVDVIRALAGHVGDHLPKLLADVDPDEDEALEDWRIRHHAATERGRIFAEDILDITARARGLAYPNRTPVTIACSCGGGRVTIDTDPDRFYTCPACGDHGVLAYWQRREAPPMTSDPMPLAHLTDWLLRHHHLPVTLDQLRHWTKGDRPALRPTTPAGRDQHGRRTPALYDPVAALAVARQRATKGRRSA